MRRIQLIEFHDQPWFPGFLRDQVTDALQLILHLGNFYQPMVGRLRRAVEDARARQILDLCSGAGGPWLWLYKDFDRQDSLAVPVSLTDKYPNASAFTRAHIASHNKIHFHAAPVNATEVPPELEGFRTIFTSFHHFPPREAQAILQDAVDRQQGIAILEVPGRHILTIVLSFLVPVAGLLVTPFLRPFRWSRLLLTYVIPIVPLVLGFDGIVSCLRVYSPRELAELTERLSFASEGEYQWDIGEEHAGLLPITYLIGYPTRGKEIQPPLGESASQQATWST
jgi:hypothetical protein